MGGAHALKMMLMNFKLWLFDVEMISYQIFITSAPVLSTYIYSWRNVKFHQHLVLQLSDQLKTFKMLISWSDIISQSNSIQSNLKIESCLSQCPKFISHDYLDFQTCPLFRPIRCFAFRSINIDSFQINDLFYYLFI